MRKEIQLKKCIVIFLTILVYTVCTLCAIWVFFSTHGSAFVDNHHNFSSINNIYAGNTNLKMLKEKRTHPKDMQNALNAWYIDVATVATVSTLDREEITDMSMPISYEDMPSLSLVLTVWCGNKKFKLKHYLSILSVFHVLHVDVVNFYYSDIFPLSDYYNQWIQYIIINYPLISIKKDESSCSNGKPDTKWIKNYLSTHTNSVYVNTNTIITEFNTLQLQQNKSFLISSNTEIYILKLEQRTEIEKHNLTCANFESIEVSKDQNEICFHVNDNTIIFPEDFWYCKTLFCQTARYIMYNTRNPIEPVKSYKHLVPNIVHYVWFGRFHMGFMFYLSILSFIHIGHVTAVYIHCDTIPTGEYWNKLSKHRALIYIIHRPNTHLIFNQRINVLQHVSDTGKIAVAFKYGGIVVDPDVILIKDLDPQYFYYDFTVNKDVGDTGEFPDRVNMGFLISKPKSLFSSLWLQSMRSYNDSRWLWNSGEIPYKLLEVNPRLAMLTTRLQVACPKLHFKPTWLPKYIYRNTRGKFSLNRTLQEWQNDTQSFHFVFPDPFKSRQIFKRQQNIIKTLAQLILSKEETIKER